MPQRRNRRSGVEDRWTKANGEQSVAYGKGSRWRARYVDAGGQEHAKGFARKVDAQRWLHGQTAAIVSGTHVAPRDAQITVEQWCATWLQGYSSKRPNTVRCAKVHIAQIVAEFGNKTLSDLRPSEIKGWTARLKAEGLSPNYIYSLHQRLVQILNDAQYDGLLGRNPSGRRTSPEKGAQKPYVATTEQVWAIHDAMPERFRVAVLLGAFAGLRIAEVGGLKVADVDFLRGIVHPKEQYGGKPLKTDGSDQPIPIPRELTLMLSASVEKYGTDFMVTNARGNPCAPWDLERAMCIVRKRIDGLPEKFSFHDLRHYLASLLIASGADIKTVQARLRHATASTTLDIYGHLWPDADESTRIAIAAVIKQRLSEGVASATTSAHPH
jgi:integrase